ncbi:MAG: tetratricopeptide repeat protein [Phycisphaerae bacterium]
MSETRDTTIRLPALADPIMDVWSRTEPKYRRRAAVLLGLTLLLFAGLCCFTYWLRTGLYGPWWDWGSYRALMWRSFNPLGEHQVTLTDFLLFPISVEQVPIQWVIIGLLIASLASIPILVAILYRFPASIVFAAMVSGLAAMPWLGVTVLLGCAIASLRPFRLSFRYASALLGLIPVAIYFVSATQLPEGAFAMTPFHAKLAAPWVLAALGSCVICAVALAIAHLINYRPGGIAPLLALLFGIPVVLFHSQVGRDELAYRILERAVGPGSEDVFVNHSLLDEVQKEATEQWAGEADARFAAVRNRLLRERINAAFEVAARDRTSVVERCDAFLHRYTASRYIPNVLYLKGRALDLRIDRPLLFGESGQLRFHTAFPRPQSRPVWQQLYEQFPDSRLASFALFQAATFETLSGEFESATALLDSLLQRDVRPASDLASPETGLNNPKLFGKPPPSRSLGFDPRIVLTPARRLREILRFGVEDPRYGTAPLRELLSFNARLAALHDMEGFHLAKMLYRYPGAAVEPHLAVRLALRQPSARAVIDALMNLVFDDDVAHPFEAEALYCLGRAQLEAGRTDEARAVFEQLLARYPESAFAAEAARWRSSILKLEIAQAGFAE